MRFSRYVFLWLYQPDENKTFFIPSSLINELYVNPSGIALICKMRGVKLPGFSLIYFLLIWRPPALPHRLQCSTIGRLGLNHRVRDGNGCAP